MEKSGWLEWGYNGDVRIKKRSHADDRFFVKISKPELRSKGIEDAKRLSVEKLQDDANGLPLTLMLSGGFDSQFLLHLFMQRQVTFIPTIMKLTSHLGILNHFDFTTAMESCNRFGLTPMIHEIDVVDFFLSNRFMEYGPDSQCNTIVIYCFLDVINSLKGSYFVMGQGDVDYFGNHYIFREQMFNIQKFADARHINGCSRFYEITYDIFHWFDRLYYATGAETTEDVYKIKERFMAEHYGLAPREKSTGFNGISKVFGNEKYTEMKLKLSEIYPTSDDDRSLLLKTGIGGNIYYHQRSANQND